MQLEADQFFDRNKYDFDKLPIKKQSLIDFYKPILEKCDLEAVLEVGCHIGDLLNYIGQSFNCEKLYGIEPSEKVVTTGRDLYKNIEFINGVLSDDKLLQMPEVDLAVVNDVFCWISRETIFKSICNLDSV